MMDLTDAEESKSEHSVDGVSLKTRAEKKSHEILEKELKKIGQEIDTFYQNRRYG